MCRAWEKTPGKFGGGLLAARSTKPQLIPLFIFLHSLASYLFMPEICGFIKNESSHRLILFSFVFKGKCRQCQP